jgi:hypothetical protein
VSLHSGLRLSNQLQSYKCMAMKVPRHTKARARRTPAAGDTSRGGGVWGFPPGTLDSFRLNGQSESSQEARWYIFVPLLAFVCQTPERGEPTGGLGLAPPPSKKIIMETGGQTRWPQRSKPRGSGGLPRDRSVISVSVNQARLQEVWRPGPP